MMECLAPQETTISSGEAAIPFSLLSFWTTASLRAGVPALGVYFVSPRFSALIAAVQMDAGVLKSGSPAAKLKTSRPADFMAFALAVMARVGEGLRKEARLERGRSLNLAQRIPLEVVWPPCSDHPGA
mgnify:CR=1 FL=1